MKKYKQVILGIIIGAFLFRILPALADMVSYVAYQASFPVVVDGQFINLDKPIVTIDGSTYLPLRAMGDVLGVKVNWNEALKQAEVTKGDCKVSEQINTNYPEKTPDGLDVKIINGKGYIDALIVAEKWKKKGYLLYHKNKGMEKVFEEGTYEHSILYFHNGQRNEKGTITKEGILYTYQYEDEELANKHYINYETYVNDIMPLLPE